MDGDGAGLGDGVGDAFADGTVTVALPNVLFNCARTFAEPDATAWAVPLALTITDAVLDESHDTSPVTEVVEPSLKLADAVKLWLCPTARVALEGDKVIELRVTLVLAVTVFVLTVTFAVCVEYPMDAPLASNN